MNICVQLADDLSAVPRHMQFTLHVTLRRDYRRPHGTDGEPRTTGRWASHTAFRYAHLGIAQTPHAFSHGFDRLTVHRALRRIEGRRHSQGIDLGGPAIGHNSALVVA